MDNVDIQKTIELELEKRKTTVLNKNAINALFEALPSPMKALGKIFIGRDEAIQTEQQKIAQDIILDLLVNIDKAITQALEASRQKGVDWKVIAGQGSHRNADRVKCWVGRVETWYTHQSLRIAS
jgi:hypothetical protein